MIFRPRAKMKLLRLKSLKKMLNQTCPKSKKFRSGMPLWAPLGSAIGKNRILDVRVGVNFGLIWAILKTGPLSCKS